MAKRTISVNQALDLARQHKEAGNLDTAERLFKQVLKIRPNDPEASAALGLQSNGGSQPDAGAEFRTEMERLRELYDFGDFKKLSLKAAEQARRYPHQPMPLTLLGTAEVELGRSAEGIRHLRKSVSIAPDYADAWNFLGMALLKEAEYSESLSCFEEAERQSSYPKVLATAHRGRGKALELLDSFDEAKAAMLRALEFDADPGTRVGLGGVLVKLRDYEGARKAFREAIAGDPSYAPGYQGLGELYYALQKYEEAVIQLGSAARLDPNNPQIQVSLGMALAKRGKDSEAANCFRNALKLEPGLGDARHFLDSVTGATPDKAPQDYVEKIFDGYAHNFETSLVDSLGYRGTQVIGEMIVALAGDTPNLGGAVDMGCGTGLMGKVVSPWVTELVGIDLSRKMLEKSAGAGVYTELLHGDVVEQLKGSAQRFGLALASDVFIYIGNLRPVLDAAYSSLLSDGLLAFSTEHLTSEADYELLASGRYAHSQPYVQAQASSVGFKLIDAQFSGLRQEDGEWIQGGFYLFQRP